MILSEGGACDARSLHADLEVLSEVVSELEVRGGLALEVGGDVFESEDASRGDAGHRVATALVLYRRPGLDVPLARELPVPLVPLELAPAEEARVKLVK